LSWRIVRDTHREVNRVQRDARRKRSKALRFVESVMRCAGGTARCAWVPGPWVLRRDVFRIPGTDKPSPAPWSLVAEILPPERQDRANPGKAEKHDRY
jgi:hypothetical protein